MKNEARALLTMQGTLSSIARVADHINSMIESGNAELEEKIIASGKTINDCWKYITFKAKELAGYDNNACIEDDTVFGWAVHYYEDNEDAEKEMNPKPAKTESKTATTTTKTTKSKSKATTTKKSSTSKTKDDVTKEAILEALAKKRAEEEKQTETQEDIDYILGEDDDEEICF